MICSLFDRYFNVIFIIVIIIVTVIVILCRRSAIGRTTSWRKLGIHKDFVISIKYVMGNCTG